MKEFTENDLEFFTKKSSDKLNFIIAGMTDVLDDTDEKVEYLKSQKWYQRMLFTIIGKNKATKEEIKNNHNRINVYLSEAIGSLFERNCIDEQMILVLGNRINAIYSEHNNLKVMLGSFVSKLNEKIESVDNFHILETEIEQGIYSNKNTIYAISKILSLMDYRTFKDERKIAIITRSISQQGIISDDKKQIRIFLREILDLDDSNAGTIFFMVNSCAEGLIGRLVVDVIRAYYFLDDTERLLLSKDLIVENTLTKFSIDASVEVSSKMIYGEFYKSRFSSLAVTKSLEEPKKSNEINNCIRTFLEGDYQQSYTQLKNISESNKEAYFYLGLIEYYMLIGKNDSSYENAMEWFEKGYKNGECFSSIAYYMRLSEKPAEVEKIVSSYYEQLMDYACGNDSFAQWLMAMDLLEGCFHEKDLKKAFEFAKMSAENENFMGQSLLAQIYCDNQELCCDDTQIYRLSKKAAEKKYYPAQNILMYEYMKRDDYDAVMKCAEECVSIDARGAYAIGHVMIDHCNNEEEYKQAKNVFIKYASDSGFLEGRIEFQKLIIRDNTSHGIAYRNAVNELMAIGEEGYLEAYDAIVSAFCIGSLECADAYYELAKAGRANAWKEAWGKYEFYFHSTRSHEYYGDRFQKMINCVISAYEKKKEITRDEAVNMLRRTVRLMQDDCEYTKYNNMEYLQIVSTAEGNDYCKTVFFALEKLADWGYDNAKRRIEEYKQVTASHKYPEFRKEDYGILFNPLDFWKKGLYIFYI